MCLIEPLFRIGLAPTQDTDGIIAGARPRRGMSPMQEKRKRLSKSKDEKDRMCVFVNVCRGNIIT